MLEVFALETFTNHDNFMVEGRFKSVFGKLSLPLTGQINGLEVT